MVQGNGCDGVWPSPSPPALPGGLAVAPRPCSGTGRRRRLRGVQSAQPARAPFNALPSASCPAQLAKDLVHPSLEDEKRKHKKKRLVQSPNSYFMDVKCPGCYKITTVFSHAQTVVLCVGCSTVLCQPTGGKARLTEGCSFRRKQH
ncbi:PREDICTED: 40S ribosomal protein S27-like [Charadrius vociferus]|uniref:40S ribosomal protein S27-like n=1 Tax=Charadrius vociferus TaxID=50402 RepID=UPI000521A135|nr:PREDICTED: 40S ribosomal protein S27-like [Charadrius vociferus]